MVKYLLRSCGNRLDPVDPMILFDPHFYFANFSHPTHAIELGFIEKKILGQDGENFGNLVQQVTKDLRDHRYPSVLPQ